jgi:hypothetical protein
MGRTSIGDEPASLDSQTHWSLGRGLIDAESLLDFLQLDPRNRLIGRCPGNVCRQAARRALSGSAFSRPIFPRRTPQLDVQDDRSSGLPH